MEPRTIALIGAGLLLLVGLFVARRAQAGEAELVDDPGAPELPPFGLESLPAGSWSMWTEVDRMTTANQVGASMREANVAAFLTMIAWAEGTEREADPYRVCYGYRHKIRDLAFHPAEWRGPEGARVREWTGEKLSDDMCRKAGLSPGCVSTAAGRYQIIAPTWSRAKAALGLVDFSPGSQDAAAVWLLAQRGALELVHQGDIPGAIAKARAEWASLPGNSAGQPQRRTDELLAAYTAAGGTLA